MLEKDIENLMAAHPDEFFPNQELKLISQQYNINNRRIDLLFEDKYSRKIIIEVKRGILSREASGQAMEYYGLLKEKEPETNVELIVCANVIPNERKTFLENAGIECMEVGIKKITDLAKKYKYTFLDDSTIIKKNEKEIPKQNNNSEEITVWIFQANPNQYDILNALNDNKIGDDIHWLVNQNKNKIKNGHIGLIWMSGKDAGIYAITLITSDPHFTEEYEPEHKYWLGINRGNTNKLRVKMKVVKRLINNPIYKSSLIKNEQLKSLSILRYFQGTNFPVNKNEWENISKLI
jgi:hypothetical protein